MSDPVHVQRSRRALAVRFHGPDSPAAREASRDLAAAKLERYISATLAAAPPLTAVQRNALAELLRPVRKVTQRDSGAA
jgi:hypothetical protein